MKFMVGGFEMFQSLPPDVQSALSRQVEEKSYKKGEVIHLEGDPSRHMWFVKSGRVHAAKTLPNGSALTVCRVEAGGMFGMCCDFKGSRYACQATAATDAVVIRIPIHDFLRVVKNHPAVAQSLVTSLTQRLAEAQRMRSMGQKPVEQRMAALLMTLKKDHGDTLPFTRREIAEMVGTTVETAIRVMSGWEKKGWIQSARGTIRLVETAELQALSEIS